MSKTPLSPSDPQHQPKPSKSLSVPAAAAPITTPSYLSHLMGKQVLQLQRMIGNQGVRQIINGNSNPEVHLQRADVPASTAPAAPAEGLMGQDVSERYARKIHAFTSDPANTESSVTQLKEVMEATLNEELSAIGIPHVYLNFGDAGGARACFTYWEWDAEINPDHVFGGVNTKIKDLDADTLMNAIGTVYHECRHAEQYFRVAQLFAMDLQRAQLSPANIRIAMKKHLKMLTYVIDAAIAHPLDANVDPAIIAEIRLWTNSFYGADKAYRNLIYNMYDAALKSLDRNAETMLAAIPPDYPNRSSEEQSAIAQQLAACTPVIQTWINRLINYRDHTLKPELERVLLIPISLGPDDNNDIMLRHLSKLLSLIDQIIEMAPLPVDPMPASIVLTALIGKIDEIEAELLSADYALPEQADAEEAEAQVEAIFAKL